MISEPEISRRCLSCGASVRSRARYCPQCGREMVRPSDEIAAPDVAAQVVEPARTTSVEKNIVPAATVPPPPPPQPIPVVEKKAVETQEPVKRSIAPVAVVEEKPEERFAPRVERLRQASTGMLDEAADDPEVRFLLVAAFLFVLFVLVLIITSFIK